MSYYVPGLGEKDPDKTIRSLMQAHEKTAATEANVATNTADIATNAADIAALQAAIAGPPWGTGTVTSVATAGLATGGPITTTGTVTVTAATKSDQQTATSTTTGVTPARMQDHDGVAKAWVAFDSGGTIGAGYNVSSVTKNATGDFTVNFTTAFASANYVCQVTSETGGGAPLTLVYTATAKTASAIRIAFENASGAALTDPTIGHVVCYGRQ